MRSYNELDSAFRRFASGRAVLLEAVATVDRSGAWRGDGATDLASWLCARYQMSRGTARELVRDAKALAGRPALASALAEGAISVDQCKALITLCEEQTDDDERWLEVLPFWSYVELEREARKAKARELERRDDGVYFRASHTADERYLRGEFQLHPEDGAAVLAAIDARIPQGTPLRDFDHAAASALVGLAKDGASSSNAPRPTMIVSVEEYALNAMANGVAAVGLGNRTGFVGSETARRLACDSTTQTLAKDVNGQITGIGHATRDISPATRRAVMVRDGGVCAFPGCGRDRYLECHHIVHRADGGAHSADNLVLVCWTHHSLVHESGWSLRGRAGPNITWVRPDGQPFEPRVRVTLDTS